VSPDRAEQREAAYRAVLDHLPAADLSPESHRARARKLADIAIAAYEEAKPQVPVITEVLGHTLEELQRIIDFAEAKGYGTDEEHWIDKGGTNA
jgi:hypothetical protein